MRFLLDTNVISEVRKPAGSATVKRWLASVRGADLYLSVLVVGEIRQGVERLRGRDPVQAEVYERWLATLGRDYAARVLPISTAVAEVWGRLNAERPLPVVDGLLAATALVHELTLATRNVSDVAHTGVSLIDPFNPGSS
ncbi:MAG: type II toxin-antitoxin system VapC family toxin [Chloroflexota bacterium]